MHDAPTLTELVDKLESLGTSEHIAMFFEDQGIKARCSDAFNCAIAQYIETKTTGLASVTPSCITLYPLKGDELGALEEVSIKGGPLQQFVSEFDKGKYPELVADNA